MSLTQRVKQGFLRLPFVKKAILLSSSLLMLSAVLPWYDNRNSFGVGETYLGIQGPLFLLGILVMTFGAISFFNMAFPLMGRNFFRLKRKSGVTAMILGAQSLFLLIIANSIFFHPSFGTNISHKGTRFGMLFAFASIAVMITAGWMTHRKERNGKFDDIDDIMLNPIAEPVRSSAAPINRHLDTAIPVSGLHDSGLHNSDLSQSMEASLASTNIPVRNTAHANMPSTSRSTLNRPAVSSTRRVSSPTAGITSPERPAYGGGVDPLTLDPKTRYKMMRSQARQSNSSQGNMWGNAGGTPYSGGKAQARPAAQNEAVNDSMKIRMDL